MKKIISCTFIFFIFFSCFAQRYEIWVESSTNKTKGNFAFSNDSVLMLYSNPSLLFPTKDKYFTWDEIDNLKIRNKSKNQMGQLIGASAGFLAFFALDNSMKKTSNNDGFGFFTIVVLPVFVGTGTLFGHLSTRKKNNLHLYGMNPKEKNNTLKSNTKRKPK